MIKTQPSPNQRTSGVRSISGSVNSGICVSKNSCVYSRKQSPARTRPARPARCEAAALEVHTATRLLMCVSGSYRVSFTRPVSTTKLMSSIWGVVFLGGRVNARAFLRSSAPVFPSP